MRKRFFGPGWTSTLWEKLKYWWTHKHTWVYRDSFSVSTDMGQWADHYDRYDCSECSAVREVRKGKKP